MGITEKTSMATQQIMKSQDTAAKRAQSEEAELLDLLDKLVRTYGRVELVVSGATVDVRCGGTASYSTRLRDAVQNRVQIEADRVSNQLMGSMGGMNYAGDKRTL